MAETFRTLIVRNEESFSFLYQETLDRLAALGPVEYFDPEDPNCELLIVNCELLYLPGGYPVLSMPSSG